MPQSARQMKAEEVLALAEVEEEATMEFIMAEVEAHGVKYEKMAENSVRLKEQEAKKNH